MAKERGELSERQNKLIAEYVASGSFSKELLEECRENHRVLAELSNNLAMDRVLTLKLGSSEHDDFFTKEVVERVKIDSEPSLSPNVIKALDGRRQKMARWKRISTMAAGILLFVGLSFMGIFHMNYRGVAVVSHVAGAFHGDRVYRLGERIRIGGVQLDTGYSQFTLDNGVELVLEAPTKIDIKSEDLVIVHKGKMVARVPKNAIGFRVDTPRSQIVDLGTEFGVDVSENGNTQVHVLDGEVKARASEDHSYMLIAKNEAREFGQNFKVSNIENNPEEFMRVLPGMSASNPNYLHWSFDERDQDGFISKGKGINGKHYFAYDRTKGGRGSIESRVGVFGSSVLFDGESSWLETDFPGIGESNPRTVAFWVKVPINFSENQAYGIISWGVQEKYSSWQISPNPEATDGELGRVRISTYFAQVIGDTDLRDGKWHHVAVVLYGGEAANTSTHVLIYVDGRVEKTVNKSIARVNTQLEHPKSRPLSMGRNIGFNPYALHVAQNFFKGELDELFIFEAALSQRQINEVMKHNGLL